jgi:hypothetical protein
VGRKKSLVSMHKKSIISKLFGDGMAEVWALDAPVEERFPKQI